MFKKVLLSLFILLSSKSFGYSQQNYMRDFGEVIKQENSVSNQVTFLKGAQDFYQQLLLGLSVQEEQTQKMLEKK